MRDWEWLDPAFLASAHTKPARSVSPAVDTLFIGTWASLGILVIFALLWAFLWRRRRRVEKRPWWVWLGWGLALVASVCASLWSVYFLGSGVLGWVVPSLAAIVIPLYVLWYQQTNQIDTPVNTERASAATDSKVKANQDVTQDSIARTSLSKGRQQTVADPSREELTLADLGQVINIVSEKLRDKDQVDSITSVSNLRYVRYPTGRADARQLWRAVFEAALDEPPETLILLLNNIRDSLGTRSRSALEASLSEVGLYQPRADGVDDRAIELDRTVRLRAELRTASNLVVVRTETGQVAAFPYDEEHYRNWQLWLRHQAHGSYRAGKQSEFQQKIDNLTQQLADLVDVVELGRQVKAIGTNLSTTAFLRVELADRELDIIPWELLTLPVASQLSGSDVCVYRAVRATKRQATPSDPPQRLLLIHSGPLSELPMNFLQEADSIRRQLEALEVAGFVRLDSCRDADPGKLSAALDRPVRAVHVVAHGAPGQVYLRQGIENVGYPSKPFAQFFSREPQPVAVTLSILDSAQGTPDAPGVVRAVAEAGVANVVGMYSAILPQAASIFYTSLYHTLGRCSDMAAAYAEAVAALRSDTYPNCGFWSVPVLYSQENVILFPGTPGDPQSRFQLLRSGLDQNPAQDRAEVTGETV